MSSLFTHMTPYSQTLAEMPGFYTLSYEFRKHPGMRLISDLKIDRHEV
jgi:hypothetical protein